MRSINYRLEREPPVNRQKRLKRVRKTETAQRLLDFNRDRTETVDRDLGRT